MDEGLNDCWDGESDPLAALEEGRRGPFEAFVEAETPRFLAFFQRLGARRAEAEDLTQETFLKLFRMATAHTEPSASGAPGHYHAEGRFIGYAFRVARNAWIDRTRRSWTSATGPAATHGAGVDEARDLAIATAPSAEPAPEAAATRLEESSRVRAAVEALPETHRAVFELGVMEELPYATISEALEIPVGTVKSRMHTAVRRIREALERPAEAGAGADRGARRGMRE